MAWGPSVRPLRQPADEELQTKPGLTTIEPVFAVDRLMPPWCSAVSSGSDLMPNRTIRRLASLMGVLAFVGLISIGDVATDAVAADDEPLLRYGYRGSRSAGSEFRRVMEHEAVQSLLLEIAAAPRTAAEVDGALATTGVTANHLEELGLVARVDDEFTLAFSLLTRDDMSNLREIAEDEGKSLAQKFLGRRSELETLLTAESGPPGDWHATAFILVGCVSLDWDGLDLVEERGYLAVPPEGGFLPSAYQSERPEVIRQLYWGSHNYTDTTMLTTFGDHSSLPRLGLPDVLSRFQVDAPESVGARLKTAATTLVRKRAGALMLQLRDGRKSLHELATATDLSEAEARVVLDLLLTLEYASESKGSYQAMIPVLTERDRSLVREVRRLGRELMAEWLDERHERLHERLSGLTPQRYGVPVSHSFYWAWHYLFGVANRELVASGLFADPYSAERTFQGFIPAVFELDVVQGPL